MAVTDAMQIDIVVGRSGFEKIRSAWTALAENHGYHFLHFPGWYEAQLANLTDDSQVYFLTLNQPGEGMCAVLPLERRTLTKGRISVPILQLFYENEMGVNDILSRLPLRGYYDQILAVLRQRVPYFALLRWQCLLRSGCAVNYLISAEEVRCTHQSKYIDFSLGLDNFWASYSSKFRKGLQKKLRKGEDSGVLRLQCATEGQALEDAFTSFLAVEDSGWKGAGGTSVRKQPKKLAYYQTLLRTYGELGLLQINILYLDDTAIAAQFGIRVRERLYLLKIGFSEEHAAISPGYLILYKLIEEMGRIGEIKAVSFVTGVDWIDRWHPATDAVGIAYSDNGSVHGRALLRTLQWYLKRRTAKPSMSLAKVNDEQE